MEHRSFICVFPPAEATNTLLNLQNSIKHLSRNVRWEKKEKFHFTLQFFGNQSEEWLHQVHDALHAQCESIESFPIAISKIGCFPNRYSPKIFWAGSEISENERLVSLAGQVQTITQQYGLQPEKKPFHPHITIGRGKGKIHPDLIKSLETVTFHPVVFPCARLQIMKSVLAESGSTYSTLFTIPLKP